MNAENFEQNSPDTPDTELLASACFAQASQSWALPDWTHFQSRPGNSSDLHLPFNSCAQSLLTKDQAQRFRKFIVVATCLLAVLASALVAQAT